MLFRSLVWLVSRIPLRLGWLIGWALAWLWWTLIPIRKRQVVADFSKALPGVSPGPALRRMLAGIVLGPLGIVVVAMLPDVRGTDKRNRIV